MKSVTMPAFEQAFKQQPLMLLDVRESDEFSDGHIEGAISVPLSILSEELARLDKKESYYVICLAGGRSARACELLTDEGYDVTNVMGGMSAWPGDVVEG
ncbi:rhodanese-like domain-containing protein [Brochothrix thermosphacta]|uniref:rhodanese-like domain-containing protein n=1 Tax=Brochothrix thermosphacta TaxID=2756 RepID=UPI000D78F39D|nr:rhodanese-like domain-containing protein [Brochothrix thermosphacta]SPN75054.1 putative rhodanese-related sulfurtransferase [Brochothrix thermosphacta]